MNKKHKSTVVLPQIDDRESEVTHLIKDGKIADAYLAICLGSYATNKEFEYVRTMIEC